MPSLLLEFSDRSEIFLNRLLTILNDVDSWSMAYIAVSPLPKAHAVFGIERITELGFEYLSKVIPATTLKIIEKLESRVKKENYLNSNELNSFLIIEL